MEKGTGDRERASKELAELRIAWYPVVAGCQALLIYEEDNYRHERQG